MGNAPWSEDQRVVQEFYSTMLPPPSRREAAGDPTALPADDVFDPVVQPARATLPELHSLRPHAIPPPVRRTRDVAVRVPLAESRERPLQLLPRRYGMALRRRRGSDPGIRRTARKVRLRLILARARHRPFDPHLTLQLRPIEQQ